MALNIQILYTPIRIKIMSVDIAVDRYFMAELITIIT